MLTVVLKEISVHSPAGLISKLENCYSYEFMANSSCRHSLSIQYQNLRNSNYISIKNKHLETVISVP